MYLLVCVVFVFCADDGDIIYSVTFPLLIEILTSTEASESVATTCKDKILRGERNTGRNIRVERISAGRPEVRKTLAGSKTHMVYPRGPLSIATTRLPLPQSVCPPAASLFAPCRDW